MISTVCEDALSPRKERLLYYLLINNNKRKEKNGKKTTLAYTGLEPVTFALLARRSNQLS